MARVSRTAPALEGPFYDLVYSSPRVFRRIRLNGQLLDGIFEFFEGEINYYGRDIDPSTSEPCIEFRLQESMYTPDVVLYLLSYHDDPESRERCNQSVPRDEVELYRKNMFNLFHGFAKLLGINRIELRDGTRIISKRGVEWNLRILNSIERNSQPFYERRFHFRSYSNFLTNFLESPTWKKVGGILPELDDVLKNSSTSMPIQELLSKYNLYDEDISVIQFVRFLKELYDEEIDDTLYKQLSDAFIQYVDAKIHERDLQQDENVPLPDAYYKDIVRYFKSAIRYEDTGEILDIQFTTIGGKRKTKRKIYSKRKK
jgi:hypothetical protein